MSGAERNASVALCAGNRVLGACLQERITRIRAAGFNASGVPDEALDEMLRQFSRSRHDVKTYAFVGSNQIADADAVQLEHHCAHACAAFLPSGFESAVIVICDDDSPHISVWNGEGASIAKVDWPWRGPGLADLYSQCADVLGFPRAEHRMEALARLAATSSPEWAEKLFRLDGAELRVISDWRDRARQHLGNGALETRAEVAAALQSRIGDLLVEILTRVKREVAVPGRVCLGGSLFHNSHFNSRARLSGLFDDVYVPTDPGNAGLSLGAALYVSGIRPGRVGPFLGPSYGLDDIKATLDNCKLMYRWASERDAVAMAVEALTKGRLVAWFEGPMEYGARALGARSILANPFSAYVLDNLNRFLKHREPWRGYALSGLGDAVREHLDGPDSAPFMECDYVPKDRDLFRHVLPTKGAAVRVHTVESEQPRMFHALLRSFGEATGLPILVNTSFNGFLEPIVCNPRDAIRVFFGTGIDMLVFGQFILTK